MFRITGFADEIGPDPALQIDTLKSENIRYIEFRAVWGKNVLALSQDELKQYKRMLDDAGIAVSAIGSPVGKIRIDEPFEPELVRFRHSLDVAQIMGAPWVRVFSYYPPEGGRRIQEFRDEVLDRMLKKVEAAAGAPVKLFNENETELYGEEPQNNLEIVNHCGGVEKLAQCFDPANFVYKKLDPWQAWQLLAPVTRYFHIKDITYPPNRQFKPAGQGDGRIPDILKDAMTRFNYDGFVSLEPHLTAGGKMAGHTGPELYKTASQALKSVLESIGAQYE